MSRSHALILTVRVIGISQISHPDSLVSREHLVVFERVILHDQGQSA